MPETPGINPEHAQFMPPGAERDKAENLAAELLAINAAGAQANPELQKPKTPVFEPGLRVAVNRNPQIEGGPKTIDLIGWTVDRIDPATGRVIVHKEEEKQPGQPGRILKKDYSAAALAALQPPFLEGQRVSVESAHGNDGWEVMSVNPNGQIRVAKNVTNDKNASEGDLRAYFETVSAADLERWRQNVIPAVPPSKPEKSGFLSRFRGKK